MAVKLQLRRGTTAEWSAENPVLAEGEIGVDLTEGKGKIGDGSTAWNSLAYGFTGTPGTLNGRGAWSGSSVSYSVNDVVDNDGSSYFSTADHTSGASTEPGVGASWATVWQLLAAQGVPGDVVGPSSSTDGNIALMDGTTGKLLKEHSAGISTLARDDTEQTRTDSEKLQLQRNVGTASHQRWQRGKVALIFDDGYRNNVTVALPILAKYGFAATIAVEVDRVGQNYNGDPNKPVVTADDMRTWIRSGGEIANHPDLTLTASEATMASEARAENALLVGLLTGEQVWNGSAFVAGSLDYPEFSDYTIRASVYRGGSRNLTSDRAYYTVFDKARSISGAVATYGDHLNATDRDGEFTQHWTAVTADPDNDPDVLEAAISFIRGVAACDGVGIIYSHFSPATAAEGVTAAVPYIHADHLEKLCRAAHEAGVEIVPFSALGRSNMVSDPGFAVEAAGRLAAGSGDTAQYSNADVLNGLDNAVVLTATAYRTNMETTSYSTDDFVVTPFTRYRVRMRYKIETDLTLNGGTGNTNHGVWTRLKTFRGNTANSQDIFLDAFLRYRHVSGFRVPYQATRYIDYDAESGNFAADEDITGGTSGATATIVEVEDRGTVGRLWLKDVTGTFQDNEAITGSVAGAATADGADDTGWATVEYEFFTGNGFRGSLAVGLFNCTGTLKIGHLSVEKLDSLLRRPHTIEASYNTTIGRDVYLPTISSTGNRDWRWQVEVIEEEASETVSNTVNFAFSDSASVPSPTAGQTCYVLGVGLNSFAARGGQIGTYDGAAWGSWATPTDNTMVKATTNGEGFANAYYHHHRRSGTGGQFTRLFSAAFRDPPLIRKVNGGQFRVFCTSGKRADNFVLIARPVTEV